MIDDSILGAIKDNEAEFFQQKGLVNVSTHVDPNPDEAANNFHLAQKTGIPYEAVKADASIGPQFEAANNARIIKDNPHLAAWFGKDSAASEIAYDDIEQLDSVGKVAAKLVPHLLKEAWTSGSEAYSESLKEIRSAFPAYEVNPEKGYTQQYLISIANLPENAYHFFAGLLGMSGVPFAPLFEAGAYAVGHPLAEGIRQLNPTLAKIGEIPGEPLTHQEAYEKIKPAVMQSLMGLGGMPPESLAKLQELTRAVAPYIATREVPPVGIHPEIDKLHGEQAKADAKLLANAQKEVNGSKTRERSPEALAQFLKGPTEGRTIGISSDAVRELYGNKVPSAEDGLLGWVPDIEAQLKTAATTGSDIEVPMANWLARVEPQVASQLHDHIRLRSEGMTLAEVAEHAKPITEEPLPAPQTVEQGARREAQLDPLAETGQTLRLKRGKTDEEEFTEFELYGDRGQVGSMTVQLTRENLLYVENILGYMGGETGVELAATKRKAVNAFGIRQIAPLLDELQREYPTATRIGGYRISGARDKAGATGWVEMPLRGHSKQALAEFGEALGLAPVTGSKSIIPANALVGGEPVRYGALTLSPTHSFSARDAIKEIDSSHLTDMPKALFKFFGNRLEKLAGDTPIKVIAQSDWEHFASVGGFSKNSRGVYLPLTHEIALREDLASGAWGSNYTAHVVVHEITHAATVRAIANLPSLKGDIKRLMDETKTFLEAADTESLKAHNYAFSNEYEFIAEAFSKPDFQKVLSAAPMSEELASRLGAQTKGGTVWQAVREIVKNLIERLIGIRPTDTILDGIFNVGERVETQLGRPKNNIARILSEEGEVDPELFARANAIGMTEAQFKRYMKLIAKRNAEDLERSTARATAAAAKRQTAEWKENEAKVREQVKTEVDQRPDIAADEFLRSGPFTDVKTGRLKLNATALSEEQKASLPKEYYGKDGVDPSDIAGYFGYSSSEAMVKQLATLDASRKEAGLTPAEFKKNLVDSQVEQKMQAQFGNLKENILNEARESILTDTQNSLLHEEVSALAAKAGFDFPLSKEDFKKIVQNQFKDIPTVRAKNMEAYLRDAGRAGRAAEAALLKEDYQEAFRQRQAQALGVLYAGEAKKLRKEIAANDKLLRRFSSRQVNGIEQEYTNHIHSIMQQIGALVRRSVQDLEKAIGGTSLEKFVAVKEADLREVPVADFLYDSSFKKSVDEMSVEEFRAVDQSLKSLVHNGRNEMQMEKAGEKADLDQIKAKMIDQLQTFDAAKAPPLSQGKGIIIGAPKGGVKSALRTFVASHLQLENLLNRWDRFDPKGVFNQYVMRPLAESSNRLAALEREYSRQIMNLKDKTNLKETIENPLFIDPLSKTPENPNGTPFIITRKNLRAIMANIGNESNLTKLAKGYGLDSQMILDWVKQVATKEDWDFVQKQGDIFARIKEESDRMYRRIAGIEPEAVDLRPIDTPHGTYPGWYHPMIYDRLREGTSKKLMGGIEETEYYRATTPAGYTKQRTGYAAPVSLELDDIASRMKQMLHDIAMREAVINAGKIFYDKDVRAAIAKHSSFGPEAKDALIPYLKDAANNSNIDSAAAGIGARWSEFFRQNVISTLIGLNPGTVMKHGPTAAIQSLYEVGPLNFAREFKGLWTRLPSGQSNWAFAMEHSEELGRRHRHYAETLGGGYQEAFQEQNLRTFVQHIGSYPVAMSDFLSAVPTWLAAYRTELEAGGMHGDGIYAGDRAVRRAHGSTAMTNRPAVMRGGAMSQWFTSLFGFFNHIMNRQVELVWRAKDTIDKASAGELSEALKDVPKLASGLFVYLIAPALIEEAVTPMTNEAHESWGAWAAKAIVKTASASWLGVRDVAQAMLSGHDPSMGLIGVGAKASSDTVRDILSEATKGKDRAGKIIEHGTAALGVATGLTNAQLGRTSEFVYNHLQGKDRPRSISGIDFGKPSTIIPGLTGNAPNTYLRGIRHGESKEKRR